MAMLNAKSLQIFQNKMKISPKVATSLKSRRLLDDVKWIGQGAFKQMKLIL